MSLYPSAPKWVHENLLEGLVIPAHPLALNEDGQWDAVAQRALSRYYLSAGAGGLAVGVHTTQFEIRDPAHQLLDPVLKSCAETARRVNEKCASKTVLVAGICGKTDQALSEAQSALDHGYHLGLLSLAAWRDASEQDILQHCHEIARVIPLFGFYLQPAVGGRLLSQSFWRRFVDIPNVYAIKIAPFNRYQTLDVMRAVAESDRWKEVAMYTGNDDQIVLDLLSSWKFRINGEDRTIHFCGGLLGHWAVWTYQAVQLLESIKMFRKQEAIPRNLFVLANEITESNAALFDAANGFQGCIAGIQQVLFEQGFLSSSRCLNPEEKLSPGQDALLQKVRLQYPHLIDDAFVAKHLDDWLSA
jgi:dihydrodipicolinate synthase/N-acetylneuraminate lyase